MPVCGAVSTTSLWVVPHACTVACIAFIGRVASVTHSHQSQSGHACYNSLHARTGCLRAKPRKHGHFGVHGGCCWISTFQAPVEGGSMRKVRVSMTHALSAPGGAVWAHFRKWCNATDPRNPLIVFRGAWLLAARLRRAAKPCRLCLSSCPAPQHKIRRGLRS